MRPDQHYDEAEHLLREIEEDSSEARSRIEKLLADGAYAQAREAADVMARMVELGFAEAQVHATLATARAS